MTNKRRRISKRKRSSPKWEPWLKRVSLVLGVLVAFIAIRKAACDAIDFKDELTSIRVRGVVKDESDDKVIEGVRITIKNYRFDEKTDEFGIFKGPLKVRQNTSREVIIHASCPGYDSKSKKVTIPSNDLVKIILTRRRTFHDN